MTPSTQSLWERLIKTTDQQPSTRFRLIGLLKKREHINVTEAWAEPSIICIFNNQLRGRQLRYVLLKDKVKVSGRHKRWVLRIPNHIHSHRAAVAWTFGLADHAWTGDIKET